jgi:hypothetical protein
MIQTRITPKVFFALLLFLLGCLIIYLSQPTRCNADGCPQPAAYGRQPYPTEIADNFQKAGTNKLVHLSANE